jgi:hypothetical protein
MTSCPTNRAATLPDFARYDLSRPKTGVPGAAAGVGVGRVGRKSRPFTLQTMRGLRGGSSPAGLGGEPIQWSCSHPRRARIIRQLSSPESQLS